MGALIDIHITCSAARWRPPNVVHFVGGWWREQRLLDGVLETRWLIRECVPALQALGIVGYKVQEQDQ